MSNLIPTREERVAFLEERQAGVRSSDMPRLYGLYGSPLEVYYEKTRPIIWADEGELVDNLNLLRGTVREREVLDLYLYHMATLGYRLEAEPVGVHSKPDPECDVLATHVDLPVTDLDSNERWPLEAKAPSVPVYRKLAMVGFSVAYYIQLQVHIACWEAERGVFAASNLEPHGLPYLVTHSRDRDDQVIRVNRQVATHFWHEHVVPRIPPSVDEYSKYLEAIEVPEPVLEGEAVVEERLRGWDHLERQDIPRDRRTRNHMRRLLEARALQKRGKAVEAEARGRLQVAMRRLGVETMRAPGIGWCHWRPRKGGPGNVDVKLLEAARAIDRDALVRLLSEKIPPSQMEAGVNAARILEALETTELDIDVDAFRKPRADSRPFLPYEEKVRDS